MARLSVVLCLLLAMAAPALAQPKAAPAPAPKTTPTDVKPTTASPPPVGVAQAPPGQTAVGLVITTTIGLPYTVAEFNDAAQTKFKTGLAKYVANDVTVDNIKIVSVTAKSGRRHLSQTGIDVKVAIAIPIGGSVTAAAASALAQTISAKLTSSTALADLAKALTDAGLTGITAATLSISAPVITTAYAASSSIKKGIFLALIATVATFCF